MTGRHLVQISEPATGQRLVQISELVTGQHLVRISELETGQPLVQISEPVTGQHLVQTSELVTGQHLVRISEPETGQPLVQEKDLLVAVREKDLLAADREIVLLAADREIVPQGLVLRDREISRQPANPMFREQPNREHRTSEPIRKRNGINLLSWRLEKQRRLPLHSDLLKRLQNRRSISQNRSR